MTQASLHETAAALVVPGKGILAADESSPTIEKRDPNRARSQSAMTRPN